jgi:hypothetical protein
VVLAPGSDPEAAEIVRADAWIDRAQQQLHGIVWRSAMWLDNFGREPETVEPYQAASGSLAVAMLWNEFDGLDPRVRFRVDLPLPELNERVHAFVGRVNRDEFVTERDEPSGAFPRYSAADDEDQTLAGLTYMEPAREGRGRFSAGVGMRLRSGEPDPYVKAAWQFERMLSPSVLLRVKETVFWQRTERLGLTSRIDLEQIVAEYWHLRWTGSGTISQGTAGVRGYTTFTATRALPARRALIFRVGLEGESNAPVPVTDFGLKVGYRRSIARDWLILELRGSLTWPKEEPHQPRKPSWGFGVGCEVYFGDERFSTQPVTF